MAMFTGPVKVDPAPKRRTALEAVRDEDDLAGVPSDSVR
jgi:hypothetical protein